ncbi:MAG TPA: glycosyltransferase family 4 protein [Chthoniobacterales bacterium]|nr:glycosyltransferase family 4 protein [Chthoniobacterales bacterium]
MNIALVRRGFSRTGGAESYIKRLGRELAEAGHTATLYSTKDWPRGEWPYGRLVQVTGSSPLQFAKAVQSARQPEEMLYSLERLLQCDCYRAGDGVHKLWLKRRVAHEAGWRTFFRFLNRKHAELLQLESNLFREGGAGHVIANSRMIQREIIATFGYPEQKITVIYNGLPETHFAQRAQSRAETRQLWRLDPRDFTLLFAGSGWERKGLKYLIEAIEGSSAPHVKLLVAGKGKKGAFRSGRARFLGPVAEMHSLLMAADLFVLPTVYDPFSNACLEALSYGLPVITTMSNGFSDIIVNGVHGTVIDRADNVTALREAIQAWEDPARRETARDLSVEVARRYTMKNNVDQTLRVLEALR